MMNPSDEARALAKRIYRQIAQGNDDNYDDCTNTCATMIDYHTAALRAEVEALRAERDNLIKKSRDKYEAHHALALEYLEAKDYDLANSSRTLASCYLKVEDWLQGKE